nr:hypothetical protein [uncultured Halomonas sp.]
MTRVPPRLIKGPPLVRAVPALVVHPVLALEAGQAKIPAASVAKERPLHSKVPVAGAAVRAQALAPAVRVLALAVRVLVPVDQALAAPRRLPGVPARPAVDLVEAAAVAA